MFEFIKVSKQFQVDFWKENFLALDELSFKVEGGKIIGFLGANGAGKTTSLKILMDFIPLTTGQVQFSPELGQTKAEIFQKIGYLPERPYFYPHLTGRELVTYMGRLNKVDKKTLSQNIIKWSERFNIAFALDRKIKTYSKGMLQRIGFVSALVHEPQLIILDEPVAGLDPVGRKEIKDVIIELFKEGKTVFFSSHIVPDVEEICQEVVFIEKGKLVYQGSIDKLISENYKTTSIFKVPFLKSFSFRTPNTFVRHQSEEFSYFEVSSEQKDAFLDELKNSGISIESLIPNRPSLEEILYKVRGPHEG